MSKTTIALALLILLWLAATLVAWQVYRRGRLKLALYLDLLAVGGLVALTAGFFWQVLLQDYHIPIGGGDMASFIYPRYSFAAQHIAAGSLPLWLPHLYAGQPYQADIQSGLLYPLNLLVFLLIRPFTYRALEYLAILHYLIAGLSMYLLGRRLSAPPLAALAGAVIWEFSGFLVAHLGHYNMLAVAVWLPLIMWALTPALRDHNLVWTLVAASVLAVSTLAGHTQLTLLTLTACLIYAIIEATAGNLSHALKVAALFALFLITTGLLALVQLWPSWELTNLSLRSEITYQDANEFKLIPHRLITFVIPHFYGRDPTSYWGPPSLTENFGYVGIAGLALALTGLILWRRQTMVRFALVLSVIGVALSLGDWTPFHGWLYELAPGYDKVRAPGRFLFFVDFGLAILATYGARTISRPFGWRQRPALNLAVALIALGAIGLSFVALPFAYVRLIAGRTSHQELVDQLGVAASSAVLAGLFALAALTIFLAYRARLIKPSAATSLAISLLVIDLFIAGASFNTSPNDPTAGFQHQAVVNFLKSQPGIFRIDTVTGVEDVWQPDGPAIQGLDSVWGLFNPFVLEDYYWYWKIHTPGRSSDLYDMLNARYVLAHPDVTLDAAKFVRVFDQDKDIHVFENKRWMPRAWLVAEAVVVSSHGAALAAIKEAGFDPRHQVVLEKPVEVKLAGQPASGQVTISDYAPNRIKLIAETSQPAIVVLSEVYYPGWEAILDGKPANLLRANWTFRAVAIEAGRHEIELRFRPSSFLISGAISALSWLIAGLAVMVGAIVVARRRRRRIET